MKLKVSSSIIAVVLIFSGKIFATPRQFVQSDFDRCKIPFSVNEMNVTEQRIWGDPNIIPPPNKQISKEQLYCLYNDLRSLEQEGETLLQGLLKISDINLCPSFNGNYKLVRANDKYVIPAIALMKISKGLGQMSLTVDISAYNTGVAANRHEVGICRLNKFARISLVFMATA